MALIVNSIGSAGGRDYSTIQSWHDAIPSNVVASGNSYQGECYNDSEFAVGGVVLTVAAHTCDASHTILLTAASGQSFQGNANVRNNPLYYDQSTGVGLRCTVGYTHAIVVSAGNSYFNMSKLQIVSPNGIYTSTGNGNSLIKDCIFYCGEVPGGTPALQLQGENVTNMLLILAGSSTNGCVSTFVDCAFLACTVVGGAGGGRVAFGGSYCFPTAVSCAVFGKDAFGATTKNNATDLASLAGTNNQTSVTYNGTTPFVSTVDYRAVAGTALAGNGFLDATNAPNDISGYPRSATPTIGCWEITSAARRFWLLHH